MKNIAHTWHYKLEHSDNALSLYFNDRLIAMILKPSEGRWPVHATINEKMYSFTKRSLVDSNIYVTDAISGEAVAVIKKSFFSFAFPDASFLFNTGDEYKWYSNSFFSLHWKWKKGKESIVDAIDDIATRKPNGVIAMSEYKNGTDLLIISGFFLSLLSRSKLSMGIWGLRRKRLALS